MNSSDQKYKLPNWLFIVTDVALIAAAAVIAQRSAHPLSGNAIIGIVTCVGLGALVGLVPLIVRFERQKNEMLDDRQRALEALAQTLSSAAEQISIAAAGLNAITDLTHKNLKHAEQLPHKLQEKIAEFQANLAVATDAEKEELERELLSLRTTESERLESVSQRIAKSAADWTKLEQATNQHLTAATEALGKLSLGTASAIGKAQAAAEQALAQARVEAARTIGAASGEATRSIESAKQAGLAELEAKLGSATAAIVDRVARELSDKLGPTSKFISTHEVPPPAEVRGATTDASKQAEPSNAAPPPVAAVESSNQNHTNAASTAPIGSEPNSASAAPRPAAATPKRPRKVRKEEPPPSTESVPNAWPAKNDPSSSHSGEPPVSVAAPAPTFEEPAPVMAAHIAEVSPVAPLTAHPFAGHIANGSSAGSTLTEAPAVDEATKAGRKRAVARKAEPDVEPSLGLDLADATAASMAEPIITSDGATRLVVTAYIGIGNRLFIRGEGPGLSWEKGVPLQFVSIGKWRWETADANAPVQFKLYKNDDVECTALGKQNVAAGHQREVTAGF